MIERLALFLPHLKGGGAEKMMLNLAEGFVSRGVMVDILLLRSEGEYLDLIPKNAQIFNFTSIHPVVSFCKFIRYLRKERCGTILATFGTDVLSLIAKKTFKRDLRVFVRLARPLSREFSPHYSLAWRTSFRVLKYLLPSANGIISISHDMTEDLIATVPGSSSLVETIYNPTVKPDIIIKSRLSTGHPWMDKNRNIPVILSVGRLAVEKDHVTLLKAFSRVMKETPVRLVLLGQGPLEKKLKSYVQDLGISKMVDFVGFKKNPYSFMASADVTVLSSISEGCPNALIESMACGTPVVSTNCLSGPREVLVDGRYGSLVPTKDDKKLAEEIIKTLKKPLKKLVLQKRSNDFSLEVSLGHYMKFLGYT